MTKQFKIASLNIRGISSVEKRRSLLNFCLFEGLDIIGLQEVTFNKCSVLESHFNFISNIGPRKLGTGLLIRKEISYKKELLEPDGRLIAIDIGPFTIINIYAPPGMKFKGERDEFFRKIFPSYASTTKLPLIVFGDFNCIDDVNDLSKSKKQSNSTKKLSRSLIEMIAGFEQIGRAHV